MIATEYHVWRIQFADSFMWVLSRDRQGKDVMEQAAKLSDEDVDAVQYICRAIRLEKRGLSLVANGPIFEEKQ